MTCPAFVALKTRVFALNTSPAGQGKYLWDSISWSPPHGKGTILVQYDAVNNQVIACVQNYAYGLDPDSGKQNWSTEITSLDADDGAMLLGSNSEYLYVGTGKKLAALIPSTGDVATEIKTWTASDGSGNISMIQTSNLDLVVSVDGYLYGLSPQLQQLWYNELDTYGTGMTSLTASC